MPKRIRSNVRARVKTYLREWREHRNVTQQQLATQLETTPATISRIESGEQPYTQDTLELIAHALRTTPAALISRRPADEDQIALWSLLERATSVERRQLAAIARVLIGGGQGISAPVRAAGKRSRAPRGNLRTARETTGLSV